MTGRRGVFFRAIILQHSLFHLQQFNPDTTTKTIGPRACVIDQDYPGDFRPDGRKSFL